MTRTPITPHLETIPSVFHPLFANSAVYDSSCSRLARVYYIEKDQGYFLKVSKKGTLAREAEMTRFFSQKGLTTAIVTYLSDTEDWLLTTRVAGEDCTHADYLANPTRLCDLLADRLRLLHETDHTGCAVQRTAAYLASVEAGYRTGVFHPSYFSEDYGNITPDEAYALVCSHAHFLRTDTLLHGDYCLPNIILNNWQFSGFIDLGGAGVGDPHIDLFWGAWTLRYNLKTDRFRQRFFDAYGREQVSPDLLRVIAAAEVFG